VWVNGRRVERRARGEVWEVVVEGRVKGAVEAADSEAAATAPRRAGGGGQELAGGGG